MRAAAAGRGRMPAPPPSGADRLAQAGPPPGSWNMRLAILLAAWASCRPAGLDDHVPQRSACWDGSCSARPHCSLPRRLALASPTRCDGSRLLASRPRAACSPDLGRTSCSATSLPHGLDNHALRRAGSNCGAAAGVRRRCGEGPLPAGMGHMWGTCLPARGEPTPPLPGRVQRPDDGKHGMDIPDPKDLGRYYTGAWGDHLFPRRVQRRPPPAGGGGPAVCPPNLRQPAPPPPRLQPTPSPSTPSNT